MTHYYSPHTGEHIATDTPADWMGRTNIAPPKHDATQSAVFVDGAWAVVGASPPAPEKLREQAKAQRAAAVEAITVTTAAGHTFDGDETSQTRMARAIIALQATGTPSTLWVLADNTPIDVPVAELVEALALSGAAQSAVWVLAS